MKMDKLHAIYWFVLVLSTVFAKNFEDLCVTDELTCNATGPANLNRSTGK